ncbi:zf-TFIIB domain-containing protein [Amnibacterium kyonggiense]
MERRCPACGTPMLPRTLSVGTVIDTCPNCGMTAV